MRSRTRSAAHGAGTRDGLNYGLDPELPNIATVLKEAGYVTLGMVNVSSLCNDYGFATGFDYYSWDENGAGRAGETVDEYLRWMDENSGNPAPVFCLMHFYDVHSPYDPPAPFDSLYCPGGSGGIVGWSFDSLTHLVTNPGDRDHLVDMYDGEIAWVDTQIGRLMSELRARALDDNTLVIITADHGEEFLEHGGWGHSHSLWQEILHVPLIICGLLGDESPGCLRGNGRESRAILDYSASRSSDCRQIGCDVRAAPEPGLHPLTPAVPVQPIPRTCPRAGTVIFRTN